MMLLVSTGFSASMIYGDKCLNSDVLISNHTMLALVGEYTNQMINITDYHSCDYGCDQINNHCKTIDAGYGGLALGTFVFFIIAMFWLSHYFKPMSEFDGSNFMAGLSYIFLFAGLFSLLGLLLFIGSLGFGYANSFISMASNMLTTIGTMWEVLLGMFILLFTIAYFIGYTRKGMDKRFGDQE